MEILIIFIIIVLSWFILSKLSGKQSLILIIVFCIGILLIYMQTQEQNFTITAFIIACVYALLLTSWFNNSEEDISIGYALFALLGSGFLSILLAKSYFYPFWNDLAYKEVTKEVVKNWWIFSHKEQVTEIIARHSIISFLDNTAIIAGPVEELAKLFAVLMLLKKKLVSRKLALFYVVLCALGFAMIENIAYFFKYNEILFARANPAHAIFSAIWGAALGSWFAGEKSFFHFLWMLLLGMGLHAIWNFFATIDPDIFIFIFILVSWTGLSFIKAELQKTTIQSNS